MQDPKTDARAEATVQPEAKKRAGNSNRVLTVVGIVLCVILVPILIVNCTLIIKSFIHKDKVPDFGGILPMIVLTDSMYPDIKSGDLIFSQTISPEEVEEGTVISFFDPAGNGTSVVTHKVVEVVPQKDGTLAFRTHGINNNSEDRLLVPEKNLVGRYTGVRIPFAGNVALFMQTPYGLILCVFVPFALIIGFDLLRRRKKEKAQSDDVAVLMAELEALRAERSEQKTPPPPTDAPPTPTAEDAEKDKSE